MAKSQVGVTSPNDNQERLDRPTTGENARERLLAGAP